MSNYNTVSIGLHRRHPSDQAALVVTERLENELTDEQRKARDEELEKAGQAPLVAEFTVRMMRSLRPGMSYPEIAADLENVIKGAEAHEPAAIFLLIDATGLGQPILDLFRERLAEAEARIISCLLTSNDQCIWGDDERGKRQVTVGKRWILSQLQVLLQTGGLKLPRSNEAAQVAEDLLRPPPPMDPAGDNLVSGGFSVGRQDGLLTALGLTVLESHKKAGGMIWFPRVAPRLRRSWEPLSLGGSR